MSWLKRNKKQTETQQPKEEQIHADATNGKKSISAFALLKEFVAGDVFLRDVVQKQYLFALLIFLLSLIYINNQFLYEGELRELEKERKELKDLKMRSLTMLKDMKEASRRTKVLEELNKQGSDLQEASEPKIIID